MTTYAIGDVQGCYRTLMALLEKISFDAGRDRLWLVGDLVNRGPDSLEALRWAIGLGDRLTMVLGNHDLHLLALAEGIRVPKSRDTLDAVLRAPDRGRLLDWLSSRPLLYREDPYILVHAGLLPSWSVSVAQELSAEVENALRSGLRRSLLDRVYHDQEELAWDESLTGLGRLRVVAGAFTVLRTCTPDGRFCEDFSGPPELAPPGCIPWFEIPTRQSRPSTVIFGHWAALGLRIGPGIIGLDTGCVWGGPLTAIRLEDGKVFQVPNVDLEGRGSIGQEVK